MQKILIVMGRYLPGYKDGGPVRSVKNMVDRLGERAEGSYEFRILCTDRDHGDTKSYAEQYPERKIRVTRSASDIAWNRVGNADVCYVEPGGYSTEIVEALAAEADLLYMCGCFNDYARVVLGAKRRGRIRIPVIIAAMGLFSPGAFHIHYAKKRIYTDLLRRFGYFRNVNWSATDETEKQDILREVYRMKTGGPAERIFLTEDLPRMWSGEPNKEASHTSPQLRIVFLSRISRKKNLTFASRILQAFAACTEKAFVFEIYGNREDEAYWKECEGLLTQLPPHAKWDYAGTAAAEQVPEVFVGYDVFLFPTQAENYGHVVLEAMQGGCIPLISDRTAWTREKTQEQAVIVPLQDESEKTAEAFAQELLKLERAKQQGLLAAKQSACAAFAKDYLEQGAKRGEQSYRDMFRLAK